MAHRRTARRLHHATYAERVVAAVMSCASRKSWIDAPRIKEPHPTTAVEEKAVAVTESDAVAVAPKSLRECRTSTVQLP